MTTWSAREWLLTFFLFIAAFAALYFALRLWLMARSEESRFVAIKERARAEALQELQTLANKRAQEAVTVWRADNEPRLRQDAIAKSGNTIAGKTVEHFAPFHPDFAFNPRDARFLGSPIDLILFDGLSDDRCDRVVFLEVKANDSDLTVSQRQVRDAIEAKRVEWRVLRVRDPGGRPPATSPNLGP